MGTFLRSTGGLSDSTFIPYLNTGTLLDVANGNFIPSVDGHMILNGGISQTTGQSGREQRFKTTQAIAYAMGVLSRYKDSEFWVHDTEMPLTLQRVYDMSEAELDNLERVVLTNAKDFDMAELFIRIRKIAKERIEHAKDHMVETPFMNPKTRKPITMMKPIIILIDSWSRLQLLAIEELYDKHGLGDSKLNMVDMKQGKAKAQFMQYLPILAAKAGIYFILSAHVGDKYQIDPFAKAPKDLQHMNHKDTLKSVGSQFTFLTSTLLEARSAVVMTSSDKGDAKYPDDQSTSVELSKVTNIINRGKNNMSGMIVPNVVSQHSGINRGITNYDYLSENKNFGLDGSNVRKKVPWMDDVIIMRTTIRRQLKESYELNRSIELLAQFCYIHMNWSTTNAAGINLKMDPKEFTEKLAKDKALVKDVINSRGYWTYDKEDKREYMSIVDVLNLLQNGKIKK